MHFGSVGNKSPVLEHHHFGELPGGNPVFWRLPPPKPATFTEDAPDEAAETAEEVETTEEMGMRHDETRFLWAGWKWLECQCVTSSIF